MTQNHNGHSTATATATSSPDSTSSDSDTPPLIEEEPTHLKLGVSIQNLVKVN